MSKLTQLFPIQTFFDFFGTQEKLQFHISNFLKSRLGKVWSAIPWKELIKTLRLNHNIKGVPSMFSPRAKLALMFLKNFTGASDRSLIEQLNANIHYQLFCGINLERKQIKDYKVVSKIRCELAKKLEIKKVQKVLMDYWSPYIKNKDRILMDATCYETDMRYPTDQKLLWEAINYSFTEIVKICKKNKIKCTRTKFREVEKAYLNYSRRRNKSYKNRRKMTKRLLTLLAKMLKIFKELETKKIEMPPKYNERIANIAIILDQQTSLYKGDKVKNRLVSLSKTYIRPIVRGKESKRVEFGAKVNKVQIDGIDLIEKISFDNFNECKNYESSIKMAKELTGSEVKFTGADAIYATNENRTYASNHEIKTDFTRKGKAGKNEKERKEIASSLRKERSTSLEGSFGTDKRHYGLDKIKARTEKTEKLWIFFGIHVKNCLKIGRRKSKDPPSEKYNLSG